MWTVSVCMCVYRTQREAVFKCRWVDLWGVVTFGLFIFLLCCFSLFLSVQIFMPPARNPCRLCVRRHWRFSRQSELREWASLLQGRVSDYVLTMHCDRKPATKKCGDKLTWPEGLCVSNSNEAGVVNFGLRGETKHKQVSYSWTQH